MAVKENVNIKSKASEKNNHFKFFKEMKAEVKRITWPSKDDTKKALIAVGVVVLIYLILVGGLDLIFTKMIYVTAGNFNEEISKLNDFLSVSAITVKDHLEKVQTTKHHQNQLYELPVDLIDENTYRFEI